MFRSAVCAIPLALLSWAMLPHATAMAAAPAAQPLAQKTIDDLDDGVLLTLPPGRFRVPPGGLIVDKQITIQGANPGRNRLTSGTILVPSDTAAVITILHEIGNITLRDLIIDAEDTAANGIAMDTSVRPASITLERVTVWHARGDGIRFAAGPGASINNLLVRDCVSNGNGRDGLVVTGSAFPRIEGGYYAANGRSGIRIDLCSSARLRDVYFEDNMRAGDPVPAGQLVLRGGFNHVVDGCVFEDFAAPAGSPRAVRVENAQGTRIDGCMFTNAAGRGKGTGVEYLNVARDNWLGVCTWRNVTTPWSVLDRSTVEVASTQAREP